jgi:hypothetical protein
MVTHTRPASPLRKYFVGGGLAAIPLMIVAIAFSFSPQGTYLIETPAGRAIVQHGPQTATNETPAGRAVAQPGSQTPINEAPVGRAVAEPGAAIHISPYAVGAGVSNVRIVGFERALKDDGKGSRIDHFEAYRSRTDVSN